VVPLTVLGDLVQRGIPADQARLAIVNLVSGGASMEEIAQLPSRVDVGLRVGASPAKALEGAEGEGHEVSTGQMPGARGDDRQGGRSANPSSSDTKHKNQGRPRS
jgi:hypothetical protein